MNRSADLVDRVARLDARAGDPVGVLGWESECQWAIQVASEITHTSFAGKPPGADEVFPHVADEVVATSRLLSSLRGIAPES